MIRLINVSKTFTVTRSGGATRVRRTVRAVRRVTLDWAPGEFLAVVGESGCGKSTLGRMIAGISVPSDGQILWNSSDTRTFRGGKRKEWSRIAQLIPQDPYAALNPVRKIRSSFSDPLLYHHLIERRQVDKRVEELLASVGLDPRSVMNKYPHQLSGGQRQRVVVARAMTVSPQYLIADEAVSMVDVSLRLGIMDNMKTISKQRQLGLMFITHDFRVARYIAQGGRIVVMYLGRIIESGPTEEILANPLHPYTQALISAVPILGGREVRVGQVVPTQYELTEQQVDKGCSFAPRCPFVTDLCREQTPELVSYQDSAHYAACHYAEPRALVARKVAGEAP